MLAALIVVSVFAVLFLLSGIFMMVTLSRQISEEREYVEFLNSKVLKVILPKLEEMYNFSEELSKKGVFVDSPEVRQWVDLLKNSLPEFANMYTELENIVEENNPQQ